MTAALCLAVEHARKETLLAFDELPIRIGRDPTNHCRLEFAFVSRAHARIECQGSRLLLRDEGSRQGTWTVLGHERLLPGRLVDLAEIGYEFQIGGLRLRALAVEGLGPLEDRVETLDADAFLPLGRTQTAPGVPGDEPPAVELLSVEEAAARAACVFDELRARLRLEGSDRAGDRPWNDSSDVLSILDPHEIEAVGEGRWGPFRQRAQWQEFVRRYDRLLRARARRPSGPGDRPR